MPTTATSYVKMSRLIPYQFHRHSVTSGGITARTTEDFFYNKVPDFEAQTGFRQLAHWGANVYFQFMCLNASLNIGGSTGSYCYIVDLNDTVVATMTIEKLATLNKIGDYTVYCVHGNFPPTGTDGTHFLKLILEVTTGLYWTFYSEPFYVLASHDNSIMVEYEHTENDFDIIWTDSRSQQMFIEMEGGIKSDGVVPGGKFTTYNDLEQRPIMLNAQPYNIYKFLFGGSLGIPNYLADKINRALACDKFWIDNVQYCRSEGAKLERIGEDLFPLAAWSCDLMKSDNEESIEFTAAGTTEDGTIDDTGTLGDDEAIEGFDTILLTVDVEVGETVTINANESDNGEEGDATSGEVNWGDGSPVGAFDSTFFGHEYSVKGTYTVTVYTEKSLAKVFTIKNSHVTACDMSGCEDVVYIGLNGNYMTEAAMTAMIETLPDRMGMSEGTYTLIPQEATFLQTLTVAQEAALTAKNYRVYIPK